MAVPIESKGRDRGLTHPLVAASPNACLATPFPPGPSEPSLGIQTIVANNACPSCPVTDVGCLRNKVWHDIDTLDRRAWMSSKSVVRKKRSTHPSEQGDGHERHPTTMRSGKWQSHHDAWCAKTSLVTRSKPQTQRQRHPQGMPQGRSSRTKPWRQLASDILESIDVVELVDRLHPLDKVSPYDAAVPPSIRVGRGAVVPSQFGALGQRFWQPPIKRSMRLAHRPKQGPLALNQEAPGRQSVQRHPTKHESGPPPRAVFEHHEQGIAEIEVDLEGALRRK